MAKGKIVLSFILIFIFSVSIGSLENVVKIKSEKSYLKTIKSLKTNLREAGFKNVKVNDIALASKITKQKILPTTLITFHKLSYELKLIKLSQLSALELPFRILVSKDFNGKVWVSFKNFREFNKYGISPKATKSMNLLIRKVINKSIREKKLKKKVRTLKRHLEKN